MVLRSLGQCKGVLSSQKIGVAKNTAAVYFLFFIIIFYFFFQLKISIFASVNFSVYCMNRFSVADLEGVPVISLTPPPPSVPNDFNFMGKLIKNQVKC